MTATRKLSEQGYGEDTKKHILLKASQAVDPYSEEVPQEVEGEYAEAVRQVLEEVRAELGVEVLDTYSRRVKARSIITEWISSLAMEDADQNELTRQLGSRGDLDLIHYRVDVSDAISKHIPAVKSSHVKEAVNFADEYTHFDPDPESEEENLSLFAKHHNEGSGEFTLLVCGRRNGNNIEADYAYRVYHEDVRAGEYIDSPYEYLHALTEEYGIPVQVGDIEKKLFWFERIEKPDSNGKMELFQAKGDVDSMALSTFVKEKEKEVYIALAFAINLDKYRRDLERRGVYFES